MPLGWEESISLGYACCVDSSFRITFLRFGQATIRLRCAHPTPACHKPDAGINGNTLCIPEATTSSYPNSTANGNDYTHTDQIVDQGNFPARIVVVNRIVSDLGIEIDIAPAKPYRIPLHKPSAGRIVIPRPVICQSTRIRLFFGVPERRDGCARRK